MPLDTSTEYQSLRKLALSGNLEALKAMKEIERNVGRTLIEVGPYGKATGGKQMHWFKRLFKKKKTDQTPETFYNKSPR